MTTTTAYDAAPLHAALQVIAGNCDGAVSEDGIGFNGGDTKFGKRVAHYATLDDYSKDGLALEVHSMLRTYRVQLGKNGVDYDAIPVPPTDESASSQAWGARGYARKIERERGPKSKVAVTLKDGGLVFTGNTYPVKDDIKRAGGRWNANASAWKIAVGDLKLVPWLLGKHHTFSVSLDVEAILDTIPKHIGVDDVEVIEEPEVLVPEKAVAVIPNTLNAIVAWANVDRETFSQLVAAVKDLPGRKWHAATKHWTALVSTELLAFCEDYGFAGVEAVKEALLAVAADKVRRALARDAAEVASSAVDTDIEVALSEHLFPFQRAGVAYITALAENQRGIIGDEMGLGKTRQGLSVLETLGAYPAVIVVPATLKSDWRIAINTLLPHRTVETVATNSPYKLSGADITIINYDILTSWVEATLPDPVNVNQMIPILQPKGLLIDESHFIKSHEAKRTKAALTLAERVPLTGTVTLLTGTVVTNRPAELLTQIEAVGQLGLFGSKANYLNTYCVVTDEYGRKSWGGSHKNYELNQILRQNCYVRREKSAVLKDLPPQGRVASWVDLDPSMVREYEAAHKDIVRYLSSIGKAEAAKAATRAEILVKLNTLRKMVGKSKTSQAIDWATDFVESTGRKLVVFAWHRESQQGIAAGLTAAGITNSSIIGGQSQKERDAEILRFRNGEAQVIVCSLQAGGVGLTLTEASDVLIMEQGWTPATHDQAEARIHRIGQTADVVTAHYLLVAGTIDETIYNLIAAKRIVVKAVTSGEDIDSEDAASSIFSELVDSLR